MEPHGSMCWDESVVDLPLGETYTAPPPPAPPVDAPDTGDYNRTHGQKPNDDAWAATTRPNYYLVAPGCKDIMDVIDRAGLSFQRGSAMKYLYRAGRKPSASASIDLRKAIECIQREIVSLEGGDPNLVPRAK